MRDGRGLAWAACNAMPWLFCSGPVASHPDPQSSVDSGGLQRHPYALVGMMLFHVLSERLLP